MAPIYFARQVPRPGAPMFPLRPNGITIRSQGTKAPVKTLEARDPSLAVNHTAHVADSQRFLTAGPAVLNKRSRR
jgi:hypothetical protein